MFLKTEFVYCQVMQVELQKVDTQNAWADEV
jgi:hypothetical protein